MSHCGYVVANRNGWYHDQRIGKLESSKTSSCWVSSAGHPSGLGGPRRKHHQRQWERRPALHRCALAQHDPNNVWGPRTLFKHVFPPLPGTLLHWRWRQTRRKWHVPSHWTSRRRDQRFGASVWNRRNRIRSQSDSRSNRICCGRL